MGAGATLDRAGLVFAAIVACPVGIVAPRMTSPYAEVQDAQRALTDAGSIVEQSKFSITPDDAGQVKQHLAHGGSGRGWLRR
jgi:hypothetical protein